MELYLYRKSEIGQATVGELHTDNGFYCYTLEDLFHFPKIPGKTRIPPGRFPVKFRKVLSGKTRLYRERFDWFTWHLELQDVPEFTNVYIHIGNKPEDTDGCILVARLWDGNKPFIGDSTTIFRELYAVLSDSLNKGEEIWLNVFNDEVKHDIS